MKREKRIILVGKAASGKDYFKSYLVEKGFIPSISHTTRPRRNGETEGNEYFFVSKKNFLRMAKENLFYEYKAFNGWSYGTSVESFKNSEVFIFTPSGIESLSRKDVEESVIIYFDIDPDVRIDRMNERSDADATERRLMSDSIDFMDFNTYDIRVTNPKFDAEKLLKMIITYRSIC